MAGGMTAPRCALAAPATSRLRNRRRRRSASDSSKAARCPGLCSRSSTPRPLAHGLTVRSDRATWPRSRDPSEKADLDHAAAREPRVAARAARCSSFAPDVEPANRRAAAAQRRGERGRLRVGEAVPGGSNSSKRRRGRRARLPDISDEDFAHRDSLACGRLAGWRRARIRRELAVGDAFAEQRRARNVSLCLAGASFAQWPKRTRAAALITASSTLATRADCAAVNFTQSAGGPSPSRFGRRCRFRALLDADPSRHRRG